MRFVKVLVIMISIAVLAGCVEKKAKTETITFAQDLSFLKKHTDVIIIEDIVDSGNTLNFFIKDLEKHKPSSIKI